MIKKFVIKPNFHSSLIMFSLSELTIKIHFFTKLNTINKTSTKDFIYQKLLSSIKLRVNLADTFI